MNITLNKSRTVSLELNKRELEILVALIGNSSITNLAHIVNNGTRYANAGFSEVRSLLGSGTYRQLRDILDDELSPTILKVVEFVYDKEKYGESPKWRTLHVTGENDTYIEGLENGEVFKRFLKSKITGGKIITVG